MKLKVFHLFCYYWNFFCVNIYVRYIFLKSFHAIDLINNKNIKMSQKLNLNNDFRFVESWLRYGLHLTDKKKWFAVKTQTFEWIYRSIKNIYKVNFICLNLFIEHTKKAWCVVANFMCDALSPLFSV